MKPGITYIDFGPADLMFDIETKDHPFLKSIDDCREFIQRELEGVNVRFFVDFVTGEDHDERF